MKKNLRSLIIPEDLWKNLQKEALERNISISAYVRLILSNRFDNKR